MKVRFLVLGPVLLLAACGGGSSGPVVVLDQPDLTVDRSFQQVSNVVELADGRLAMAELRDKTFLFVDPATAEVTPVGEHADTIKPEDPAPGKHKFPGYVVRFPGDTIGLMDFAAERTTLWSEQGQFLLALPRHEVAGHNQPTAYDDHGFGYKEDIRSVLGGLEPGHELGFDSLSVVRIARGDTVADTVARLKLPEWGRGQFGEQVKMVSTIFSGRDLFGVLPDGSIWVARAANNEVDWRSPAGQWDRGPARSRPPVTVSQAEKDAFLEKLRVQMAQMGAPAGIELSYPFADTKPPFAVGVTNPAGEVWLQRSRAYEDSVPVWDVVGRDGKQVRTVQFPKGALLAGFGKEGRVYLLLKGEDDRQRVARYLVK